MHNADDVADNVAGVAPRKNRLLERLLLHENRQ